MGWPMRKPGRPYWTPLKGDRMEEKKVIQCLLFDRKARVTRDRVPRGENGGT